MDAPDTAARISRLQARVEDTEALVLRVWCAGIGALLVLGLVLPFHSYVTDDGHRVSPSVLLQPGQDLEWFVPEGGSGAWLPITGFLGLTVVVAGLLVGMGQVRRRGGSRGTVRVLTVLLALAAVGTAVVLVSAIGTATVDARRGGVRDGSFGPGGVFLALGLVGYAALLREDVRRLWVREPGRR
ncbi:hypothetical protein GCM10009584_31270 [Ornithinimicrobium humiphilum]|uniref:Uncharacterized protein n=1 Tax=Ornithinimicrobium humiphilum TaxID=125288 RepID=A0A543K5E8_9MICO|nr:hypothetical protein [Ornithinimicrobium humiphilum]TQM90308.1 hypothetical protein FB476_3261 [Ornithinimicrobium humiphilum]